jgi:hypothetical protein
MKPDGGLSGHVGGYRPWEPVYRSWVNARGPVIEALTWVQLPSVYYALRRNADYSPNGARGNKTHISFALRVDAIPAYVMTPDASKQATAVISYKAQAPKEQVRLAGDFGTFRVVDGLVPDRSGKIVAGPKAVILPAVAEPASAATR